MERVMDATRQTRNFLAPSSHPSRCTFWADSWPLSLATPSRSTLSVETTLTEPGTLANSSVGWDREKRQHPARTCWVEFQRGLSLLQVLPSSFHL